MRLALPLLALCLLAACSSPEAPSDRSPNPVMNDSYPTTGLTFAHDPTLIRSDDLWWLFYTGPGIQVRTSSGDAWAPQTTKVFAGEKSWWRTYAPNMGSNDVWAPDISFSAGRYWLYYSVSEFGKRNSAIGLTSCTDLALGDWRDDGVVISSSQTGTVYNAIDPNLIADADGRFWLSFGSWSAGIYLVALDPETRKPAGTPVKIASRASGKGIEGPGILYQDGFYYLFTSWDLCCNGTASTYKVAVGRSATITGPYVDQTGLALTSGGGTVLVDSSTDLRWVASGGQFLFPFNGVWQMAYHSYDGFNRGMATLRVAALKFSDGWPALEVPFPGRYRLKSLASGKYLDSLGGSAGASVAQWTASASFNQQWTLADSGYGNLNLINRAGALSLTNSGTLAVGTISTSFQWTLVSAGTGYRIVNKLTGRCLDTGGRTADGSAVSPAVVTKASTQLWTVEALP